MNNQAHSNLVLVLHYMFKIAGIAAGFGIVYLGYRLFILGVTGKASLSIHAEGVGFQLLNASPGVFLAIGGIWIVVCAIRKGAQISSRPGKHGIVIAANEAQYPNEQSHPTKSGKDASSKPEEILAIGPHIPWDYKKGKPRDTNP